MFTGVHVNTTCSARSVENIEFTLIIIIISCVQGPVARAAGTERNQDGCCWLPGVMIRLEPTSTQGILRMGCGAALGKGRHVRH